jgi:hypothetical protein
VGIEEANWMRPFLLEWIKFTGGEQQVNNYGNNGIMDFGREWEMDEWMGSGC